MRRSRAGRDRARDVGWRDDVRRLVERLERLASEGKGEEPAPAVAAAPPPKRRRRWLPVAAVAALVVAAAVAALLLTRGDPEEPTGGAGFPNEAESRLLALIPPITRPSCQRIDYGDEAAEVSLECSGVRTAVRYNLFPDETVRDAWYLQRRELVEIEPLGGSCEPDAFRGEAEYAAGTYLCFFDGEEPQLVWTDRGSSVGAEANVWEGSGEAAAASLLRQWQCCFRPQS